VQCGQQDLSRSKLIRNLEKFVNASFHERTVFFMQSENVPRLSTSEIATAVRKLAVDEIVVLGTWLVRLSRTLVRAASFGPGICDNGWW
jgi:hypothetical protein